MLSSSLRLALFASVITLCGLVGCTENGSPAVTSDKVSVKKAHAECLVCKHENDLACVDVDVDATTPSVVMGGKTYYFCSDECKRDFQKDPQKYLKGK